jgi:hypothetical protein
MTNASPFDPRGEARAGLLIGSCSQRTPEECGHFRRDHPVVTSKHPSNDGCVPLDEVARSATMDLAAAAVQFCALPTILRATCLVPAMPG